MKKNNNLDKFSIECCFKCKSTDISFSSTETKVLKTIIVDMPCILCNNCNTKYLVSDLLCQIEIRLLKLKKYPLRMTYTEANSSGDKNENN